MKFYDSFGMNPRMVRFFMEEKGLEIERQEVDILGGECRQPEYLRRNPAGQTPMLELDDGTAICETLAICEYLEEVYPQPALIGATPEERAVARMWWRRAEIHICWPMIQGFYGAEGYELFKDRTYCLKDAAAALKEKAQQGMVWLDRLMGERRWLSGDRFTMGDICLYTYIDLLRGTGQDIPAECQSLRAWFNNVGSRPAAAASIWRDQPMGLTG
ncbi:glutathione S-transferase family protein [Allosphingosinicella sp.]|jgi:glutathione S-transferase|uniref:glutathione S-transferase family protein n=1 Tax=Allosphingosinicella sp. TaxID=2823234 RepID=UPI002F24FB25